MRAESLHALIPVAIGAGLLLSTYAWYETTYPAAQGACSFTSYFSCAKVVNSGLTTTLGIPDYFFGIGGFALLLGLDVPLFRSWERRWLGAFLLVSLLGVAVSVYLYSVETFQIHAVCPVCLGTYIANGVSFLAAVALWRRGRLGPIGEREKDNPATGQTI